MRITIKLLVSISIVLIITSASRTNLTDFYANFLPNKLISYQVHSGYEDIEKYYAPELASTYYSAWECSTKRFTDHSVPVIFYLSGGPGLSSQFAAFREFGPIEILYKNGEYSATENPWSWNYYAHLVFVDQPIGVGFSYNKVKVPENSKTIAMHFTNFLANFLRNFPYGLGSNPLYLAGQGFAAQHILAICEQLSADKSLGIQIQGIILGGAVVNYQKQLNNYESFFSGAGIVSPQIRDLFHSWQSEAIIKLRNNKNVEARASIDRLWSGDTFNRYLNGMNANNYKTYVEDTEGNAYAGFLSRYKSQMGVPDFVSFSQFNSAVNSALTYDMYRNFGVSLENVLTSGKRVLIYNGQNDLYINSAGMFTFLQDLEWKGAKQWRESKKEIWRESGKISGWVKKHSNLIVAVIKGAGHYIFQDQTSSDRSMYLMMNNYFSKKW